MPHHSPSFSAYVEETATTYLEMLNDDGLEEANYQTFFEQNPCMLSNLSDIGGQGVLLDSLISQPKIQFSETRIPDFVWLTRSSLDFCPTFIEIEKPSKNCFRQDEKPSAKFHEAHDQLGEWKALLSNDDTKRILFDTFSLPTSLMGLNFRPTYVLIIGRRSQWERSRNKIKMMGIQENDGFTKIHSFDHIVPIAGGVYPYVQNVVTCKIHNGRLNVSAVPSCLTLCPALRDSYSLWNGFHEALDDNQDIAPERKEYLHLTFDKITTGTTLPEEQGLGKFGKRNVRL